MFRYVSLISSSFEINIYLSYSIIMDIEVKFYSDVGSINLLSTLPFIIFQILKLWISELVRNDNILIISEK
jgi:hypothetical protein